RAILRQEVEPLGRAPGSRRVENQAGFLGWKSLQQLWQQLLGAPLHKFAIVSATSLRVAPGGFYGPRFHFHTHVALDSLGEFDAEKTDPAISINQVSSATISQTLSDCLDQPREHEKVVLKE